MRKKKKERKKNHLGQNGFGSMKKNSVLCKVHTPVTDVLGKKVRQI